MATGGTCPSVKRMAVVKKRAAERRRCSALFINTAFFLTPSELRKMSNKLGTEAKA